MLIFFLGIIVCKPKYIYFFACFVFFFISKSWKLQDVFLQEHVLFRGKRRDSCGAVAKGAGMKSGRGFEHRLGGGQAGY